MTRKSLSPGLLCGHDPRCIFQDLLQLECAREGERHAELCSLRTEYFRPRDGLGASFHRHLHSLLSPSSPCSPRLSPSRPPYRPSNATRIAHLRWSMPQVCAISTAVIPTSRTTCTTARQSGPYSGSLCCRRHTLLCIESFWTHSYVPFILFPS